MPNRLVAAAILGLFVGLPRVWAQGNLPPPSAPVPPPGVRTWSDASGNFRIAAEFLKLDGGVVHLKKTDGTEIAVPIELLGAADQEFARRALRRAAAPAVNPRVNPADSAKPDTPAAPAAGGGGDLSALVDRIEPAVVRIGTPNSLGSGFVVDPAGLICTNYHVIEGASEATATFKDQRSMPVLGYAAVDRGKDLALLLGPGRTAFALRCASVRACPASWLW